MWDRRPLLFGAALLYPLQLLAQRAHHVARLQFAEARQHLRHDIALGKAKLPAVLSKGKH